MPQIKVNAVQTYREALAELENAVNALDQAHAMLKDINLHRYVQSDYTTGRKNIEYAVDLADSLLRDLQNVTCPDCGQPMAETPCLEGQCPEVAGE